MLEKIIIFITGAIVGSFLNVCIWRLPRGESVVMPRSHCPNCNKTIPWYDNIPLLSYIILGAKCRFCHQRISLRYFLVELITAAVFLLFYRMFGLSLEFILYTIFCCGLIVATFVDIQHRIIPDEISLGGIFAGLILNTVRGIHFRPFIWDGRYLINSFLGIIVGGGIIYLTGFLFDLVYFKLLKKPPVEGETHSMGGGDVKLLAMIGAFLGWRQAIFTFFLAPFLGIGIGLVNLCIRKVHILPYGPFLSLAAFMSIFFTDTFIRLLFCY
jgi:leader peptidase (prepilin peptidase)/N-methyltransferase